MATHDDLIDALRLYGPDALDLSDDNRAWLAALMPASETHARARLNNKLMKLRGVPRPARRAVLSTLHYQEREHVGMLDRVMASDVNNDIKERANALERWLRADPQKFARHLKTLPDST